MCAPILQFPEHFNPPHRILCQKFQNKWNGIVSDCNGLSGWRPFVQSLIQNETPLPEATLWWVGVVLLDPDLLRLTCISPFLFSYLNFTATKEYYFQSYQH